MAKIAVNEDYAASAADVWAKLADFGGLAGWVPGRACGRHGRCPPQARESGDGPLAPAGAPSSEGARVSRRPGVPPCAGAAPALSGA